MHASSLVCLAGPRSASSAAALGIDPLPVHGVLMTRHPRSKHHFRQECPHHLWAPPPMPGPSAFPGTRAPDVFLSLATFTMSAPVVVGLVITPQTDSGHPHHRRDNLLQRSVGASVNWHSRPGRLHVQGPGTGSHWWDRW